MKNAIKASLAVLVVSGGVLLALGVIVWTGNGHQLVALHVALGVVLVGALWFLCAMAARAGVPTGMVAFAAAWGVLVVVLGLAQEELVPGDMHWTIQVLHLLISMGAIWWGRRLAALIRRAGETGQLAAIAPSASR